MKIKAFLFFQLLTLSALAQQINSANQVKEYFFAGIKDKMADNYPKAIENFTKVTALDANNDAAFYELASLQLRQSKYLEAEINIKMALSIKPENSWYVLLQSAIYKSNGNMDGLLASLSQLIKFYPEKDAFYFEQANAFYMMGKTEEAKKIYKIIQSKFGNTDKLASATARFNATDTKVDVNKLVNGKSKNVKELLLNGTLLLQQKKPDDALMLLQKAKVLAPDNFEVNLAMADVYTVLKNDEKAFAELNIAFENQAMQAPEKLKILSSLLAKNKDDVGKYALPLAQTAAKAHQDEVKLTMIYGDMLYQQGKLHLAKDQYAAALKLSDPYYFTYEKLLGVQTLLGQYTEAMKTSDDALSFFPNQAIIYYYRAFALHRNGQNAEAGLEIKNALALDANDKNLKAMIFALQAEVLIDQQKFVAADDAFEKAIAISPENYLLISNYAYYLALREHNLGKAEILSLRAVNGMPNNSSILDTHALVLFKQKKYSEALIWQQKALQNNDVPNAVYLEHYGDILFLKGEAPAAVAQWQNAQKAGGKSNKLTQKINEKKYIK